MTPQELKNSILQLAVQGKLVEQRPEEGTGEELYQEIRAKKQRLIKAGTLKKEKHFVKSFGLEVEVRTYKPIDKCKEFVGILTGYENGDVTIIPEKCDDCDLCIQNCPNQAISKA